MMSKHPVAKNMHCQVLPTRFRCRHGQGPSAAQGTLSRLRASRLPRVACLIARRTIRGLDCTAVAHGIWCAGCRVPLRGPEGASRPVRPGAPQDVRQWTTIEFATHVAYGCGNGEQARGGKGKG